jgi:hypothetical protein
VVERERDGPGSGIAWTLPLYLVRDVSRRVAPCDQDRAGRLLSEVVARVDDDELLRGRIRISILEFAHLTKTRQPLAPAAEVTLIPPPPAGSEEPRFSALFEDLADIVAADEARIAAAGADCCAPVLLLLTAGETQEAPERVRTSFAALAHRTFGHPSTGPLRLLAQTVGHTPAPLVDRLTDRPTDLVARSTSRLATEEDVHDTADDLIDAVWQAVPLNRTDRWPAPGEARRTGTEHGIARSLVRQSGLGALARLSGDDDTVTFELLDPRRREELAAGRYLRYRSVRRAALSATDLFRQTTIWAGADVQSRYWIQQRLAWPVRLVVPDHDPSAVCGVLTPGPHGPGPSPGTPSGSGGGRAWHELIQDPARAASHGLPAADDVITRTSLCAGVAETLAFVHHHRLFLLDHRLTGLRYVLQPRPAVWWEDCGSAFGGTPGAPARWPAPAGWAPPEAGAGVGALAAASEATDRYLLARLVRAFLACDRTSAWGADPDQLAGRLDAEGHRLLAAGLGDDPASRPPAAVWREYLGRRLRELTSPPEIVDLLVTPRATHEGGEITVCWRTRNAAEVQVLVPACPPVRVTGDAALDGRVTLSLNASGPVHVVAWNRFGRQERSAGTVRAVPLPSLAVPAVARPAPLVALSADPAASPLAEGVQRLTAGPLDLVTELARGFGLIAPTPGAIPPDPATWFADPPVSIPGRPRRRK